MAYSINHQVKHKTIRKVKNNPKDGDGIMKKKNMLASATSIQNLLNMGKQDTAITKYFECEFINSGRIKEIK